MLSIIVTDALCSIAHDMKLDRTSLLERLKHSEGAIDHCDQSTFDCTSLVDKLEHSEEAINHCDRSAFDRTSLLDKLEHSEEAIDHCDRSASNRSVLKRYVNIPPQDGCGG